MTETLVLPFYLLIDVSYSMESPGAEGVAPIDAGNSAVRAVKEMLDESPILADKVRFSLIDFSDDAQVVIPMSDLSSVDPVHIPRLQARGGTSFAAAFDLLKKQIEADVKMLKAEGNKVHRPAVFFLTDGVPTDDENAWRASFAALTNAAFSARPNVIPFGVGNAPKPLLDQLVHGRSMRSFVARDEANTVGAIAAMAQTLVGSVIASANSVSSAGELGGFVLPEDDGDFDTWL